MLLFAFAKPASPEPSTAPHGPKPAASAEKDSFSFNGIVSKVNYAANVVELTSNGRHFSIVLEPTTAIDIAGEPGSVSDIRPGVGIHAEGVVRNGVYHAQTIAIHGSIKRKGQSGESRPPLL